MIVSVQDEARLHGEDLRPPCAECGRPVAGPLDLVHVACERTARADAMHALLSGPPPVPGRLPARGAARLLALIGEPLAVYPVAPNGKAAAGIDGGTKNATTDPGKVAAFAECTGAVAVAPADLVCIDVDGKDDAGRLVPGLEAARMAGLAAAGIDTSTAVAVRSQSGTGLHLWWRAGAHRWPGKVGKLPLPVTAAADGLPDAHRRDTRAVELYCRHPEHGSPERCRAWLAATPGYLSADWSRLVEAPAPLVELARPPAPVQAPRSAAGRVARAAARSGRRAEAGPILARKAAEVAAAPQGARHDTLRDAAYATAGLPPDERHRKLSAAARGAGMDARRAELETAAAVASADRKATPYRGRRKADPTRAELRRRLRQAPGLSVRIWAEAGPAQGTPGERHGARWLPGDAARRVVPGALPPDVHGLAVTGGPNGVTLLAVHPDGQLDGRYRRRWENQP